MEPKVSVIVPVYKAESYLCRCVDSLLAQTFLDFEILLIDDGSPDKSGEICDEYASRDKRIRVFHKPNGGVSSARQKGLDEARGEYVIHADPDDWVEPNMLQELYAKAKTENADMVICDFFENKGKNQIYRVQKPSRLDHETVLRELFQQLHGSCWNKLVRRVCYNIYNINFVDNINFQEDFCINVMLLMHSIKVSYLNMAFYHYSIGINENSLNMRIDRRKMEDRTKVLNFILNKCFLKYPECCHILEADYVIWMINQHFYSRLEGFLKFKRILYPWIFIHLPLKREFKLILLFFGGNTLFNLIGNFYAKKNEKAVSIIAE